MQPVWNHERWPRQPAPAPHFEAMRAWFDLDRVGRVLAPMCPAADPLQQLALANVCYRPPQRLHLVYALHTSAGRTLHATVDVRGDGPETAPPASAHRVGLDSSTAALAWLLPDDPADLPLAPLLAPAFTERHLGLGVAPRSDVLLSYLPGKRLTQRWTLAGADMGAVVLRHRPGAAVAHARLQQLWSRPGRGFAMAQPLACHAGQAVRWERCVAGEGTEAAARRLGWPAVMERVAAALASLHGSGCAAGSARVVPAAQYTRAVVLDRLGGKVLRRVQAALPARGDAVATRIESLLRWQAPATPAQATLHGRLQVSQLRLGPAGEVIVLGLGDMVRGEAACDLARLATQLVLLSLLGQVDARTAWSLLTGLPALYRRALQACADEHAQALLALPVPAFHEAYAWHVAAQLLSCQLETCVRHAAAGMDGLCVELVRLAGGVLADRGSAMQGD